MSLVETQAVHWVDQVWGDRRGHCHFAFGVGGHFNDSNKYEFERWIERSGEWPRCRDQFLADAITKSAECDVYVAPYLRSNASRKKGNALPSNILYADVDSLDGIAGFERALIGPGGLLVGSGRGRHPYLRLPEELEPTELERWNRRLARALHADAGWAENKVLRLPGTWNHKTRAQGAPSLPVALVTFEPAPKDWTLAELDTLLPAEVMTSALNGDRPDQVEPKMPAKVPEKIQARLREQAGRDRSGQTFAFVNACRAEGLTDAETLALGLQHQPTIVKYGDRAAAEIRRLLEKIQAIPARIEWQRLSEIEMRSIVFIDKPLLQADAFHLVVGRKGQGKGTVLAEIAARVTRGELGPKRNVVWIGSEDSAAIDIGPRIEAAGGDRDRVLVVKTGWIQLPRDIDEIERAISKMGDVGMLVIDPVGNHIAGKNSDGDTDIRDAIAPLNLLADEHQLMIFGVRHLSEKECARGILAAILGASAWSQVPRVVLAVAQDNEDATISHIQCVAGNRLPRNTPGRMFRIEGTLLPGLENEVTRAVWIGDSNKDVEAMLATRSTKTTTKSDTARDLILDILEAEGDQESDAFDARIAQQTGLSAKTIRNLRADLKHAGLVKAVPELDEPFGAVARWKVVRTAAPRSEGGGTDAE